jgi:thymidylate kinase
MTTIINLYGAPGSGKSTIASGLFFHMKMAGFNVEFSNEYAKSKLFEGNEYIFRDQLYCFAKQQKKLRELDGKVDFVITDSPLLMSLIYNQTEVALFNDMVVQYYNNYNNMNFLLKRNHAYHTEGRKQTEQESDEVGEQLEEYLKKYNIQYKTLPSNESMYNILNILYRSI